MDSADLKPTEARARRAYELTRVRRAALAFAPVVVLVAAASLLGERIGYVFAFGTLLFLFGVGLLWYGRGLKRAVLPGLAAGIVPLVFGLCARHLHDCMGPGCWTFCVPACFAGGVIAGIAIDVVTLQRANRGGFLLAAAGIGLLTGAMGCSCAGALGLLGLVVGLGVTTIPGLIAASHHRAAT
jgi:hypothetical protein